MPPKKYCRNSVSYVSLIRRPARKSKLPDPQETQNPVQESPTPTVISQNLETPSQQTPNLIPSEEITAPVVDLHQTLVDESKIDSNVQDFNETVCETEGELKQETLVEKELGGGGGGDEKRVSESESKNVVKKKKTRIVKRIVKRKVLRKVVHEKVEVVNQDLGNDGLVSGNVEVKSVSDEGVGVEVGKGNLENVESVNVEIGDRNGNVVCSDVGKFADDFDSNPTCIVWSEAENCSVVGEKQNELEAFEVVKHCVEVKNLKSSDEVSASCAEGKVDCWSTEDLSKVSGIYVDVANENTGSVTGTHLEDCIVDNLEDCIVDNLHDQNYDSMVENNLDSESGGHKQEECVKNNLEGVENYPEFESENDKQEEGVNNKEECSEFGEMKAEISLGDTILSGEMGALERRRRRKTEIFVGGLGKDTKEEDIRKIFEVLGEIKDVTLVNSSKTKNGFAFVRYALAADAKKALIKYRKVEICGRLCGTSPVEGNDTLFLGKIDKRWKSDDVTKLLQGIGIEKIDHVTVVSDPNNIEFNRGFAFLELESNKDAQNAYKKLQKKGILGNQHVKVAWAEPLTEPNESELNKVKSVYAEYLPSSWDEQKVKEFFKRFGDIENVALARDMLSSRRKDFAFVNYTTRDAALACVEAFSPEQINDEGSKVKVKVSLAKPFSKSQQIKHLRTPPTKESKEMQKGTPFVKNLQESRNVRNSSSSNYETRIVDQRSSTTSELLQLLREQASMRPANPSLSPGFVNREYPYPLPGRKRPFPVQGDSSQFSNPRGHPRARVEGSYPRINPGVSMSSLPHHQQGASYISRPIYGMERRPTYIQPRERAPYQGNIGTYQRY